MAWPTDLYTFQGLEQIVLCRDDFRRVESMVVFSITETVVVECRLGGGAEDYRAAQVGGELPKHLAGGFHQLWREGLALI